MFFLYQELVKKCEQNVADHEVYDEKYAAALKWVNDAQERFAACDGEKQTSDDLQTKQTIVQVRNEDKIVNHCIGEMLLNSP